MSLVLFITFMDRISEHSKVAEGVRLSGLRILSLLFGDNGILLALLNSDLQFML